MKIVDLHCDTLYKAEVGKTILNNPEFEVQILNNFEKYFQCFAIWIPDDLSISDSQKLFLNSYKRLKNECKKNKICLIENFKYLSKILNNSENQKVAFFTLENCKILDNKIENVKKLYECNVKIATLTWNDVNCVGGGADSNFGITEFGKKVIKEFEKYSIIADVSHASDKLFYDVCEISNRPFIATHSNSRTITNHRRNLTDEQFKIICSRGGIVGLNFHNAFLNQNPENASIDDIIRHAYHFLSLGGENNISLGSDFDGGTLPNDIDNNEDLYKIYDIFLKNNFSERIISKIFYENAVNFFENFDI